MTTMEKVSVTLEREVADEIGRRVGPRRVSAFLNEAARQKLQQARFQEYLRELYAEHGTPDAATRRAASKRIAIVMGRQARRHHKRHLPTSTRSMVVLDSDAIAKVSFADGFT